MVKISRKKSIPNEVDLVITIFKMGAIFSFISFFMVFIIMIFFLKEEISNIKSVFGFLVAGIFLCVSSYGLKVGKGKRFIWWGSTLLFSLLCMLILWSLATNGSGTSSPLLYLVFPIYYILSKKEVVQFCEVDNIPKIIRISIHIMVFVSYLYWVF